MARFQRYRELLKEPVVQFLLIGSSFFVANALIAPAESDGLNRAITVTDEQASAMVTTFARTWRRSPTEREIQSLIDDHIRTEVYVREAMRLGLDQNDTIIRRRLRQKMEFLNDSEFQAQSPTATDLRAYFDANPDQYREDARVSFQQVFLDPERRGDALDGDATTLLDQLNGELPPATLAGLGDPIDLATSWIDRPRRDLVALFGSSFSDTLISQHPGRWVGPIDSAYGRHLVKVESMTEGSVPSFETVRADLARDWTQSQRLQYDEDAYQKLLDGYTVRRPELN